MLNWQQPCCWELLHLTWTAVHVVAGHEQADFKAAIAPAAGLQHHMSPAAACKKPAGAWQAVVHYAHPMDGLLAPSHHLHAASACLTLHPDCVIARALVAASLHVLGQV